MSNSTWPPVAGVTPGYTVQGKTTIRWGTDGLLASPYPGGGGFYTVIKMSQNPILDRAKLPQGSGLTSTDVIIIDGVSSEIVVRDDSTMTPPQINTLITIVDAAGWFGIQGITYTARIVDPRYEAALKQPGERTIIADNLLLIDSQTTGAQVAR
jgi:hypothetical protein